MDHGGDGFLALGLLVETPRGVSYGHGRHRTDCFGLGKLVELC